MLFKKKLLKKETQQEKLLSYLIKNKNKWISAKDIVNNLKMLQYNARLYQLRRRWFTIDNKLETKKTRYWKKFKMGFFRLVL